MLYSAFVMPQLVWALMMVQWETGVCLFAPERLLPAFEMYYVQCTLRCYVDALSPFHPCP